MARGSEWEDKFGWEQSIVVSCDTNVDMISTLSAAKELHIIWQNSIFVIIFDFRENPGC